MSTWVPLFRGRLLILLGSRSFMSLANSVCLRDDYKGRGCLTINGTHPSHNLKQWLLPHTLSRSKHQPWEPSSGEPPSFRELLSEDWVRINAWVTIKFCCVLPAQLCGKRQLRSSRWILLEPSVFHSLLFSCLLVLVSPKPEACLAITLPQGLFLGNDWLFSLGPYQVGRLEFLAFWLLLFNAI